jgi:glycosyltransferase involved in cell wall biosynthesis
VRVAILANWPEEEAVGGVAYYTKSLVKSLSGQNQIDLHVISFGNVSKKIKEDNAHIHLIKAEKIYYLLPFLALSRVSKELKKIDPDVIHIQGSNISPYLLVGGRLRKRYPSTLIILGIVSRESKYGYGSSGNIWSFFNRISEKYYISKIPNLVVETNSIKDIVKSQTNSKIHVVPPGIDYIKYQDTKPENFKEKPDIFMVCKIEELKGIDLLIQSLPVVLKSIPELKVYIAGKGPQEEELKTMVQNLNLEDHVKFLGFISDEEKYQYYNSCKVVAVPSRWDCQPITLFEAAASGTPVVASDMSNPEVVVDGKTGFIFESENVNDLAKKLTLLLKDEKLLKLMSLAAKERGRQHDWHNTAKRFVDIYQEVISDFHNQ